jgi:hypothetical protein
MPDRPTCAEVSDDLGALAVGALTGRERVAVLSHVEHCASCAVELESMATGADALLSLYPELDPDAGFTERTMARIGVEQRPEHPRQPRRTYLAVAACVVALAASLGVVAALHGNAKPTNVTATLEEPGGPVGKVMLTSEHGNWMVVTMDDSGANGSVACRLTLSDGATRTVGRYTLHAGYGSWAVRLPVAPSSVVAVTVVGRHGDALASAAL